jgi:hypothetical protein
MNYYNRTHFFILPLFKNSLRMIEELAKQVFFFFPFSYLRLLKDVSSANANIVGSDDRFVSMSQSQRARERRGEVSWVQGHRAVTSTLVVLGQCQPRDYVASKAGDKEVVQEITLIITVRHIKDVIIKQV